MKFDIHYLITAEYAKWIVIALISLFAILIVYEFSSLFFLPNFTVTTNVIDKKPQTNGNEDSTQYILKSSLFGVYVPNDLEGSNVKESMLNLTIVGILYAVKVEESQVIIRSADEEEKTYKIGDTVPGGAVIKRIMANGILVEHNGALESLSLPVDELNFEPQAKPLKQEE